MAERPALITGFEPYACRGINPAAEVARALAGRSIAGVPVAARTLPVSHAAVCDRITGLLRELDPVVVISLGLWPGEPMIRIERFAVNLADFEIPDNRGVLLTDQPLDASGALALAATLPLRRIEEALIAAGIPARLSSTAGTFLCNACLFSLLAASAARSRAPLCGFLHLPYLPSQVAELLEAARARPQLELHQRADLASMDLVMATRAVEIALEESLAAARGQAGVG
jgi:pyroglutamyl-peptidase